MKKGCIQEIRKSRQRKKLLSKRKGKGQKYPRQASEILSLKPNAKRRLKCSGRSAMTRLVLCPRQNFIILSSGRKAGGVYGETPFPYVFHIMKSVIETAAIPICGEDTGNQYSDRFTLWIVGIYGCWVIFPTLKRNITSKTS